jgi:hypothetical protein
MAASVTISDGATVVFRCTIAASDAQPSGGLRVDGALPAAAQPANPYTAALAMLRAVQSRTGDVLNELVAQQQQQQQQQSALGMGGARRARTDQGGDGEDSESEVEP